MKNLMKNSMLGLMIVAVAGTQVQAASARVMMSKAGTFVAANKGLSAIIGVALAAASSDFVASRISARRHNAANAKVDAAAAELAKNAAKMGNEVIDKDGKIVEIKGTAEEVVAAQKLEKELMDKYEAAKKERDEQRPADKVYRTAFARFGGYVSSKFGKDAKKEEAKPAAKVEEKKAEDKKEEPKK